MNNNKQLIYPSLPFGTVYFAQMHALRWMGISTKQCLKVLYNELLGHALFYGALLVTDSHAIQNWWLMQLLQHPQEFPGIEYMLRSGILRIAKRRGSSLVVTAEKQVNSVPVVIDGRRTKLDETFIEHARKLESITNNSILEFDLAEMSLRDRVVRDILLNPVTRQAYGITQDKIADLLVETIEELVQRNDRGLLYARDLFDLPDNAPSEFGEWGDRIRIMATSAHTYNFPLTYGIYPVVSPVANDHIGAMSLLRGKLVSRHLSEGQIDYLDNVITEPDRTVGKMRTNLNLDFSVMMKFRDLPEFHIWLKEFGKLLTITQTTSGFGKEFANAKDDAFFALTNYLAMIAESLGMTHGVDPGDSSSQWIRAQVLEIDRQLEKEKTERDFVLGGATIVAGLYVFASDKISFLGIEPLLTFLALFLPGSLYAIGDIEYRVSRQKLEATRRYLERTSRFLNIVNANYGQLD